jgi:hypothetical protein
MANISVVDDPLTGGNYGGIKSDPYTEYVDNLFSTIQTPNPKALEANQYYPSANQGVQIGSMSNETMGNMPIFGSGRALFPRAVVDNFRQAQRKAEIDYLNKLGEIDVAEYQNITNLKNPRLQQGFTNKYMGELDSWLDEAATRLGGDYMKAYHALSVDPEYHKMRKQYEDYAATYNQVFDKAVEIMALPGDEVSKESQMAAKDFVHKFENIDVNNIDTLVNSSEKLRKHVSIFDVAKNMTDGAADRIRTTLTENFAAGKDADSFVYDKITTEGYLDSEINQMVEDAAEIHTFLQDDPAAKKMLTNQLKVQLGSVYKKEFETIKRDMTTTGRYLKNNNINVDANGDVELGDISTTFTRLPQGKMGKGRNGILYPTKTQDGQPVIIPTISGMSMYVKDRNNQVRLVRVPGTFDMTPNAEYDLASPQGWEHEPGRYVEGQIDFKHKKPYSQEDIKVLTEGGKVKGEYATGQVSKTSEEEVPLQVRDELTGEVIKLYGTLQVLAPFDAVKDNIQRALPFTNRAHSRLPGESFSAPTDTPQYAPKSIVNIPDPDKEIYTISGSKGKFSYNELKSKNWSDEQIMNLQKK